MQTAIACLFMRGGTSRGPYFLESELPADPALRNAMAPYPDKDQRLAALQLAIQQLPPATYTAHPGIDAIHQDVTRLTARPPRTPPRLAR